LIEVLTGERIFEGNSYTDCAKKILAFHTDTLDRFTEQSSAEFVQFLKLLMAPKKQNRFAGSKEALHAFDKRDSNIRVNISRRPLLSKKSLIVLLCGAAALIIGIILFFSNDNSNATKAVQGAFPPKVDSISTPITSDSTEKARNDSHAQTVREPIQKSQTVKPTVIPPDTMNHAVVDSGTVLLTSTPWAKVYVDDKFIGETPFSRPLSLAAGNHTILFVHPSFDPIMQTITVLPFRESRVTGNFLDNVGYLNCLAIPWAEVYINNEYKDTTPLEKPIMLPPGKYEARFKNSSFKDIVREVTVRSKDTISISISFKDQR
jgi:hypothetical protein